MARKVFLLMVILIVGLVDVYAVRAYPLPVIVHQSDGTSLSIIGHGDEYFHYITTIDGVLLVREGSDWMVAEVDEGGELQSSGLLAHDKALRGDKELAVISIQKKKVLILQLLFMKE